MWADIFVFPSRFIGGSACSNQAARHQKAPCSILQSVSDSNRLKKYTDVQELIREMCLELIEYITLDANIKDQPCEESAED